MVSFYEHFRRTMKFSYISCVIAIVSTANGFASDAMWIGNNSGDLQTTNNWSTGAVPTGIATFDSEILDVSYFPFSTTDPLALQSFYFPNQGCFSFTFYGPQYLQFSGDGCGISGTNTNIFLSTIYNNTSTPMNVPQLVFSGENATIGDATIYANVAPGVNFVNAISTVDLAQILFDGTSDSLGGTCSVLIDSNLASMRASLNSDVLVSTTGINDLAQILFDGSGGLGGASYSGSCNATILGKTLLTADCDSKLQISSYGNNIAQILFDGSGGLSNSSSGIGQISATIGGEATLLSALESTDLTSDAPATVINNVAQMIFDGSGGACYGAGGTGSATVTINDSAYLQANSVTGMIMISASGVSNDSAQILFCGNGGTGYGGGGTGSIAVSITDSAILSAVNSYYLTTADYTNDCGQIVFDGSGGTSYEHPGTGSAIITINGNATLIAKNIEEDGYIYNSNGQYVNDIGQIIFDGSSGQAKTDGSIGSCIVTIGNNANISATNQGHIYGTVYTNDVGQILFDGTGGTLGLGRVGSNIEVVVQDQAIIQATNQNALGNNGSWQNNLSQISFDGSGGLSHWHSGKGNATITLKNSAQVIATNTSTGAMLSGSTGQPSTNDIAQILFDGSGGCSNFSSEGTLAININDSVLLQALNSSSIDSFTGSFVNNIGQIVFDRSGGLNASAAGTGSLSGTISTSNPLLATNDVTGTIKGGNNGNVNKVGQIIFDGGAGNITNSHFGHGNLSLSLADLLVISAVNHGEINQNSINNQGLGQILFDGRSNSGSGSCSITLGKDTLISALNTGSIQGHQIAFYDVTILGSGTVSATNVSGTIDSAGVAFFGSTTANNLNILLSDTSTLFDSTLSSPFSIASLSGDSTSSAIMEQNLIINTPAGRSATFNGTISGSGDLNVIGSGTQIISGSNTYSGTTTISSGTLTLLNSNIPSDLIVEAGGSFSGTGIISGSGLISGLVKPGNSPGTLHFLSGLTLLPGSTTQIEVDRSTASNLDISGGNATLNGALSIVQDHGIVLGSSFPIVTVTGADIIGMFADITTKGPYIPVIQYVDSDVTLTLQASPATFAAQIVSPDRILRNTETLKHLEIQRMSIAGCGSIEGNSSPWSLYFDALGSFGKAQSRKWVKQNTYQSIGGRFGFDYIWNQGPGGWNYGLGLITEYTHLWGQVSQNTGHYQDNEVYASLYGTFSPAKVSALSLNYILGGGYNWYTFHRNPLGTSELSTKASPGGGACDALIDIEYQIRKECHSSFPKNWQLSPILALQYTYNQINGYQETGSDIYNLYLKNQGVQTLSTLLGFRSGYTTNPSANIQVRPEISLFWQYQYLNSNIHTHSISPPNIGPQNMPLKISGFPANSLVAGADIRIDLFTNGMLQLNYDLWYNAQGITNFFMLEGKLRF
jgi:autotransporter-associated beta strand protein